ncbi:MAG TPA: SDR family NAD(P)-dependent oxidoreductase, partial [Casimicrobiaceae bacterium]|nr:SDR family NAD(P)-dependent oxidoreductase [Casimicrobiaceae bacterium]
GGTNAHVVLEEAPPPPPATPDGRPRLLLLSARSEAALERATDRLHGFLQRDDAPALADVAYTLQVGRKAHAHRRFAVAGDQQDAVAALGDARGKRAPAGRADGARRPVVFLLPGIGDHYVGMGHDLYEAWPVFREEVDRCAGLLEPHLGVDIRTLLYPPGGGWKRAGASGGLDLRRMLGVEAAAPDPDSTRLDETRHAQPALFAIEYATCRLWQALGVQPDAIVGHSMGEYVAACLAGVLSLDDALRLVAVRARLVDALPRGGMLAVMLPERDLVPLLPAGVSVALVNGPALCVVAGPADTVDTFAQALAARDVVVRPVRNAHAFHSRMLDPIVDAFEREVRTIALREPAIPYTSNVTGAWIAAHEATDPAYWARHANHTARFADALHAMWKLERPVLLEAGPGRTLGVLAMQHPDRRAAEDPLAVASMRQHYEHGSDDAHLWTAVGTLWLAGVPIDWAAAHRGEARRRVPLPTYPFERQTYWLPPASLVHGPAPAAGGVDGWFYAPSWESSPFPAQVDGAPLAAGTRWLVIADRNGGGARVVAALARRGQPAARARFGAAFAIEGDDAFVIDPASVASYVALLDALRRGGARALHVVHLGGLTAEGDEVSERACAAAQPYAFDSLMLLAQAIGELDFAPPVTIGVVTNRMHAVTGDEPLDPTMATVLGPCGVIPKEYRSVRCFNVDLPDARPIDRVDDRLLDALLDEFAQPPAGRVVAYRGRARFERHFRSLRLPSPAGGVPAALRERGVYLITGGTGGIGLAVAQRLARTCRARVVLTKKTPLPPRSAWPALLAAVDTPSGVRRTLAALQAIEAQGGEVEVVAAEATDAAQMRSAVQFAQRRFGALHGVIHAAGIVRAGLVQAKTREAAAAVLAPKVAGTLVVFDLVREAPLDFLVVFSSITSVITPYAESDYSGANAFLDAFAQYANARTRFRTVAINWPGWKEVGQLAELEVRAGLEGWKEAALRKAILTEDGLEAFARALHSGLTQVIVSPEPLDRAIEEAEAPFDPSTYLASAMPPPAPKAPLAPDAVAAPAGDVEAGVARIWRDVLGFDRIDPHDNFSQLGGHSLLAMQVVAGVRAAWPVTLTLREFFEAPTVAQLAAVVRRRLAGEAGTDAAAAPSPLSPMGQRTLGAASLPVPRLLGAADQPVFAMLHAPGNGGEGVLTVLCPPLFNESMRTQLALRELALALAERGHHVVRFDYRGTGDSAGDLEDIELRHWLDDVALAVCEGRRWSGAGVVRLAAVRAGALLVAGAACACGDVERIVLWDPVESGAAYLRAMRAAQQAVIEHGAVLGDADRLAAENEYAGYRISQRMVDALVALDAGALVDASGRAPCVVSTSADAAAPSGATVERVPFPCHWETELENLMMPKPVLERLVLCLTRP